MNDNNKIELLKKFNIIISNLFSVMDSQISEIEINIDSRQIINIIHHKNNNIFSDIAKNDVENLLKNNRVKKSSNGIFSILCPNHAYDVKKYTNIIIIPFNSILTKYYLFINKNDHISYDSDVYNKYTNFINIAFMDLFDNTNDFKENLIINMSYQELEIYILKIYMKEVCAIKIKLLNDIFDLINKFENFKIENQTLDMGFIFIDDYKKFKEKYYNAIIIDFIEKYNLNEISKHKNLLITSNGIDTFIIIENDKIIGSFTGLYPIKNILKHDIGETKDIDISEVILSINNSDIKILNGNNVIIEKIKGNYKIRNVKHLKNIVTQKLLNILSNNNKQLIIDAFEDKIFSLSSEFHGATFVIGNPPKRKPKCIKLNSHSPESVANKNKLEKYIDSVINFSKADGATLIDNNFSIYGYCATLPTSSKKLKLNVSGHGKRHASGKIYSEKHPESLVIVISQDGPISIIEKGEIIAVI